MQAVNDFKQKVLFEILPFFLCYFSIRCRVAIWAYLRDISLLLFHCKGRICIFNQLFVDRNILDSDPLTYSYSDPLTYSYSDLLTYSDPLTYSLMFSMSPNRDAKMIWQLFKFLVVGSGSKTPSQSGSQQPSNQGSLKLLSPKKKSALSRLSRSRLRPPGTDHLGLTDGDGQQKVIKKPSVTAFDSQVRYLCPGSCIPFSYLM